MYRNHHDRRFQGYCRHRTWWCSVQKEAQNIHQIEFYRVKNFSLTVVTRGIVQILFIKFSQLYNLPNHAQSWCCFSSASLDNASYALVNPSIIYERSSEVYERVYEFLVCSITICVYGRSGACSWWSCSGAFQRSQFRIVHKIQSVQVNHSSQSLLVSVMSSQGSS